MESDNSEPNIRPNVRNKDPASIAVLFNKGLIFMENYGWFLLLGIIIIMTIWHKIQPYWWKWKKKREEEYEEATIEAETLAKTQEAVQRSRMKMQESIDKKASEFAEKMKEVNEKRRQEKIADWERHQQGRGYRSKHTKPDDGQTKQDKKATIKKSSRTRSSDYNPLTGSSSGSSYRPSSRRSAGG